MAFPPPATVIHWRDYLPTHSKYFLLLGTCGKDGTLLALAITSQDHWLTSPVHKAAMVEIPQGATRFLRARSFVNCFAELKRIASTTYEQAECDGDIAVSGRLPMKYLEKVRQAVDNDLLPESDIFDAVTVIDRALGRATG